MLKPKMLLTHGLIYGGSQKNRDAVLEELSNDFQNLSVSTMSTQADGLMTLLSSLCSTLPDVELGEPKFAIMVSDAKKLFDGENDLDGSEIENALEQALLKGILVYFYAAKKSDIPEYIYTSLESMIEAAENVSDDVEVVEPKELEKETQVEAEVAEDENVPAKKVKAEVSRKKPVNEVAELPAEIEKYEKEDKDEESVVEKAIRRSASSAVSSVSRSVSTNIVNSLTSSGKKKSAQDVVKQVGTTALSSFIRNMVNGTIRETTKSKKKK